MKMRNQQELAALPIPGGWEWRTIDLENHAWRLLLPANADSFITEPAEAGDWPDPYWAQLWPAARTLAGWVLARDWAANARVLELGCGCGFVGLAALARGCQVTFSDYVPLAVELAMANARANGFANIGGVVLDWRQPTVDQRFDAIVAADVLYDPELHSPLLTTIEHLLTPAGIAWLGDPGRGTYAAAFVRLARAEGWQVAIFDQQGRACEDFKSGEFRLIQMVR